MLREKEAGIDVKLKDGTEFDVEAAEKEDQEREERRQQEGGDEEEGPNRRRRYILVLTRLLIGLSRTLYQSKSVFFNWFLHKTN